MKKKASKGGGLTPSNRAKLRLTGNRLSVTLPIFTALFGAVNTDESHYRQAI